MVQRRVYVTGIGFCDEDPPVSYRRAPLDTTEYAAGPNLRRPDDRAGPAVQCPVCTTLVSGADQLPAIAPAARDYCAAEMTAFLSWWLSELRCPVINRPAAGCLAGPGWSVTAWRRAARRAGFDRPPGDDTSLTVVG